MAGAGLAMVPAVRALSGHDVGRLELAWAVPGGAISLAIDPLSAFFLVAVLALSAVVACYGVGYLLAEPRGGLGAAWFWFNLLVASMVVVTTARNGLLFLVAWETMALSSAFLVLFHHEREEARRAGWIYLVASHLGTAFVLLLFGLLARESGSLEFADWRAPAAGAGGLFQIALVGFGAKTGKVPLHVWLPEAHPAAPSHVSALMSGVMIATGVYALLRVVSILGPAPAWWGVVLMVLGLLSAVTGVLLALAQRDLKRLLAFSSIENMGIVLLATGFALLTRAQGSPEVAMLALSGALLHVWNHALFKSGLFLAAGSVSHATGTLDLERLGGLLPRMPWTGGTLLLCAAAACALPPSNGFVGEFLIYAAGVRRLAEPGVRPEAALAAVGGLALVGGLTAACFVRAAGIALLGEPRSREVLAAHEGSSGMRSAMLSIAAASLVLGLAAPLGLRAVTLPVQQLLGMDARAADVLASTSEVLWRTSAIGALVVVGAILAAWGRSVLLRGRSPRVGATWDCGFAEPTPRMQYTATSLAQPLTDLFAPMLRARGPREESRGLFPEPIALSGRVEDPGEALYGSILRAVDRLALRIGILQSGSTHLYILYVALAALALLLWKFC